MTADGDLPDEHGQPPLTYEQAAAELEELVGKLQDDGIGVDELGASVARGAELVRLCRDRLQAAETHVKEVVAALEELDVTEAQPGRGDAP